ncbi:MAG: hypothetical protein GF419_10110 [Ignavibacteriales bacterium]|nr:hypothetical protein [Ignavibacteriales bacterium]
MRHRLIDGNNVVGKTKRRGAGDDRLALTIRLQDWRRRRGDRLTVFFDGGPFEGKAGAPVKFSHHRQADDLIREEIERAKNPRNLVVVTSDRALADFARACSCEVTSSEEFLRELDALRDEDDERRRIKQMERDVEEFKRLFGAE